MVLLLGISQGHIYLVTVIHNFTYQKANKNDIKGEINKTSFTNYPWVNIIVIQMS